MESTQQNRSSWSNTSFNNSNSFGKIPKLNLGLPEHILSQLQLPVIGEWTIGPSPANTPKMLTPDLMIITDNSPKLKYRARSKEEKKSVHWGQRKLLLSEVQFFTIYHDTVNNPNPIVVYAGAAPGIHFRILSAMFPHFTFHLYDPSKFSPSINGLRNVHIYQQIFTDGDAQRWAGRKDVYFISDIRSADYRKLSARETEQGISDDMQAQLRWYRIINPIKGLLKFHLPYPDQWHEPTYEYPDGIVYKQSWAPQSSTETRLVIQDGTSKRWNLTDYESQMFYHNVVLREQTEFVDPFTGQPFEGLDPPELTNNYDSVSEVIILRDYIQKYVPSQDVRTDVIKLSRTITAYLQEGPSSSKRISTIRK